MLFLDCPMPVLSDRINFDSFLKTLKIYAPKIPMKYSKKVKILQCLISLQMCCLRHPEHHARNYTSLAGLEQNLLFFGPPYTDHYFDILYTYAKVFYSPTLDTLQSFAVIVRIGQQELTPLRPNDTSSLSKLNHRSINAEKKTWFGRSRTNSASFNKPR